MIYYILQFSHKTIEFYFKIFNMDILKLPTGKITCTGNNLVPDKKIMYH